MRPRPGRLLAVPLALSLALGLASCGDDEESSDALETVEVSDDFGTVPEVTWEGRMEAAELESEVLVEGDGAEIAEGDSVFAHLWLGNGYTSKQTVSTWDGQVPTILTVGEALPPFLIEALEGQTIGSRVVVAAPPEDAYGAQGNASLGLGNGDSVLVVVDLVDQVLSAPEGKEVEAPAFMPEIVEGEIGVTDLDFADVKKPAARLSAATVIEGTGPKVEKGDVIAVDYFGKVFGGKKAFDETYTREPYAGPIGEGGFVQGWDLKLVGVPVGSRVMLAIPPEFGYGEKGQGDIKGTDTMYFVVDILGATKKTAAPPAPEASPSEPAASEPAASEPAASEPAASEPAQPKQDKKKQ
ncbi:FKBP-type peptidyl-prolyl cis-trans isomerase [Nocardioides pacificus]